MKQAVITFAEKYFNITFSDKTEYEEAFEKVIPKVEAMAEKLKAEKDNYKELEKKFNEQSVELEKVQTAKITALVNQGVKEGKILPAEISEFTDLATRDYDFTEKQIKLRPVNKALVKNMVSNKAVEGADVSPKLFKQDGTKWTWSELLQDKNLSILKNFSEEEKEELRNEHFGISVK